MSCISRPKQPLGWGSPCHRLHMNSLRYSCYLLTIDEVSTDHPPSVDQLLTDTSVKYRRTIGEVSGKCRWKVGKVSVKYRWTKSYIGWDTSGTTIERVSTESRPTIDRYIDPSDRSVDTTYSKHIAHSVRTPERVIVGACCVRQTQTADWQVNEVSIVLECSNRFLIPKLEF